MAIVISIVSYTFLPARTGGQKSIALFNKYFSRHVRFTCISTRNNDPAHANGYELLPLLSGSPLRYINILLLFRIRSVIKERQATHLLLEHPYYGWLGILLKWITGVKLVVHSHNIESLRWKTLGKWWWPIIRQYEKWTHRKADYNFFITKEDRAFAIEQYGLLAQRCSTITYGIEQNAPPGPQELMKAREFLRMRHAIPASNTILLFNGAFGYAPNLDGLQKIVSIINPALQQLDQFPYTIVICGKDIPDAFRQQPIPNMVFAGFVDDVSIYFMGADVFINPVTDGGGIKTKLVDALGYNLNSVSTSNGAIGIDPAICNGKLIIRDGWSSFTEGIKEMAGYKADIPQQFYDNFEWSNITREAVRILP
jgi:polysaccharide biosynthesis protein PslH